MQGQMRMFSRIAAAVAALLAWGPASGLAQDSLIAPGELVESYHEAARISGTIVAGVQSLGTDGPGPRASLSAYVPDDWETMCLRLVSRDGRYTGEQQFSVAPERDGGWERIAFNSSFEDELLDYADSEMAVLLGAGTCLAGDGRFTLTGWDRAGTPGGAIAILVNSFRADEVYMINKNNQRDFDCARIEGASRTAFDAICTLPSAELETSGTISLEINRIRNGGFDPPEIIEIEAAGG